MVVLVVVVEEGEEEDEDEEEKVVGPVGEMRKTNRARGGPHNACARVCGERWTQLQVANM